MTIFSEKFTNAGRTKVLRLLAFSFMLLLCLAGFSSCASQGSSQNFEQSNLIDTTLPLEDESQEQSFTVESTAAVDESNIAAGTNAVTTTKSSTLEGQSEAQADNQETTAGKTTSAEKKTAEETKTEVTNKTTKATTAKTTATTTAAKITAAETTTAPKPTDSKTITVALSVNCLNAVNANVPGADRFAPGGNILSNKSITLEKGSSVYDALKKSGLVINASNNFGSIYIESIAGIAQGTAGKGAGGWIYSVNGKFPATSASRYEISGGDKIAFHYTVKSGDVAGSPY